MGTLNLMKCFYLLKIVSIFFLINLALVGASKLKSIKMSKSLNKYSKFAMKTNSEINKIIEEDQEEISKDLNQKLEPKFKQKVEHEEVAKTKSNLKPIKELPKVLPKVQQVVQEIKRLDLSEFDNSKHIKLEPVINTNSTNLTKTTETTETITNSNKPIANLTLIQQTSFIMPFLYFLIGFTLSITFILLLVLYKSDIFKDIMIASEEISRSIHDITKMSLEDPVKNPLDDSVNLHF